MGISEFELRAELPHGILPESFAIISSPMPPNCRTKSGLAGQLLEDVLRVKEWPHFPATLVIAGEEHPRASFGVVADLFPVHKLAREFFRPVLLWVNRGEVEHIHTTEKSATRLLAWDRLTGEPPVALHGVGNLELAARPATAFLCGTECPGDRILEAYEWARRQCDERRTVISGFHTPVEKDVLAILARRGANIIKVPARDIPKTFDAELRTPMEEGRFLALSPFGYGKPSRLTKDSCSIRNRFVLSRGATRYVPHCAPGSNLEEDLGEASSGPFGPE